MKRRQPKAFSEIRKELDRKAKSGGGQNIKDISSYVDGNRNIAVNLDSKELSRNIRSCNVG